MFFDNGWASNLDPSGVSTAADNITIISGTATLPANTVAKNLTVNSGATLEVEKVLTLAGDLTNNGSVVFKSSSISETAQFDTFTGSLTGTGTFTTERFIPARRAFRFLSSAVTTTGSIRENWQENGVNAPGLGTHITGSGGAGNGFDPTNTDNPSMFEFDNANQSWEAVTNTNLNKLSAGIPYRLMVRGDRNVNLANNDDDSENTVLCATGLLETGDQNFEGTTVEAEKYFFIGIPIRLL